VRVPAAEVCRPRTGDDRLCRLYHSKGFDSATNSGQVWAKVLVTGDPGRSATHNGSGSGSAQLRFGAGARVPVTRGWLSHARHPDPRVVRTMGTVGDPAGRLLTRGVLQGLGPKLFGLINLTDVTLIVDSDLARMPQVSPGSWVASRHSSRKWAAPAPRLPMR
jgi:hypothetical protein